MAKVLNTTAKKYFTICCIILLQIKRKFRFYKQDFTKFLLNGPPQGFSLVTLQPYMKKIITILGLLVFTAVYSIDVMAQCSVCTKTASQLGEKPALGLNQGILYLMFAPFAIVGVVAYRWWKNHNDSSTQE
jgi:hypothetical protein